MEAIGTGHFQVVLRLVDHGDDPQAALDVLVDEGKVVELEPGLWHAEEHLLELGTRLHGEHQFRGRPGFRHGDA